jgi:FKBP-type peptidyl-prolyl cis-trans isomerase FkpA
MRRLQRILPAFLLVLLAAPACAQAPAAPAAPTLTTDDEKTLYALGLAISQGLAPFGLTEQELETVRGGLADGVLGREHKVKLEEWGPKIQALAQTRALAVAAKEREAGTKVVTDAAAMAGAKKTASGMVYIETAAGTGASPAATDTVQVHYRGTLRDGKEFDSSYSRNAPATFPLNGVIPCWTEGVAMMKVGGKAKLVCPPDLAYGDRPAGQIPAGATLTFEVELLAINPAPEAPPAAPPGQ